MTRRMDTTGGRFLWAAACAFLLAGVLASASGAEAPVGAEELVDGKALFGRFCSSCHGLDARGGPTMSGVFLTPPPDLTRIAERRGGWFPEVLIREFIDGRFAVHGTRTMPVWGNELSKMQLLAITEHLYALQAPATPAE